MRSMPSIGVEAVQQLGERRARRPQVAPVGVDVLAQQRHLAHAVGGQAADLVDELVERPADLAPARRRDDAVRAAAVAPDADLHPRLERRARACAGRWPVKPSNSKKPCAVSESLVRNSASLWTWPGPKATSTNGNCAKTCSLTDCAQQPPTPTTTSGRSRLSRLASSEVGDEALVGLLADRAGVEEDQVGVVARSAPPRSRATRACPSCARSRARSSGTRRW